MEKELRKSMVEAARAGSLFDWVSDNHWRLEKGEMKEILLCVAYFADSDCGFTDALANDLDSYIDVDE